MVQSAINSNVMPLINNSNLLNFSCNLSRYETYIKQCTIVELATVSRIQIIGGFKANKYGFKIIAENY